MDFLFRNLEYSHYLSSFETNCHEYEYDYEIICKDIDDVLI